MIAAADVEDAEAFLLAFEAFEDMSRVEQIELVAFLSRLAAHAVKYRRSLNN